jgi:hypothetical protein
MADRQPHAWRAASSWPAQFGGAGDARWPNYQIVCTNSTS